jgi:heat shock protein 5
MNDTPPVLYSTLFPLTEAEEYKDKLKEVEDVCNPIVSAAYGKGGEEGGASADEDLGDHDEL